LPGPGSAASALQSGMSDQGPVSVVTGAGSGIGRATALKLGGLGHRLVLAGRRGGPLDETGQLLEGEWVAVPTDVGNSGQAAALIDRAVERFGRLDNLVNNAGQAPNVPISETDAGLLEEVFRVNALGTGYAILAAWPVFRRQGSGCVVNVSTLGTTDPFPGFFAYAASKAAVEAMVKSCVNEKGEADIRAFAVAPGAVETAMLRAIAPESVLPRDKCLRPEEVADVIARCITGERDEMNGQVIYLSR
jgi:NAD(P)-dependent dehydrogenase (short-subunit alcohol dehydrogenase family)